MLSKLKRRLLAVNFLVFALVLVFFSAAVNWSVTRNTDQEERQRLQALSDTLSTSIEPPEKDDSDDKDEIPDVLQSHEEAGSRMDLISLQWFDSEGQLAAVKGALNIFLPLSKQAKFETQQCPHVLILTEPVNRDGHLIGYLRVGLNLSESDKFNQKLEEGLLFGTVLTFLMAGLAVVWLVRQALKPVEFSVQKLSEFTADASHELKGPLTAIKSNAAVVLKYSTNLAEEDRERIEGIHSAADQMSLTISDLLSLAANEHELSSKLMVSTNVMEVLGEVHEELASLALAKEIQIDFAVPNASLVILAAKDDLKRVLLNVTKNAIQYSQGGGKVSVTAKKAGNRVQFQIKDCGIGIGEEDLPRIFDRFWRTDKARSYRSGGSGLGLSIAQSFVHRYKGAITVQSKLGEGTTFTISFPDRQRQAD